MNSLPHITKGRGRYVPYDLEQERVDAIWNRLVDARHDRSESRLTLNRQQWKVAGGALAAAACVLLFVQVMGEPEPSAWSGARLSAGNEALRVALQDGSEIEAQPHASIELLSGEAAEVRLALHSGTGRFVVAKNRDRRFIVQAGAVQVRVVGTRFEVKRDESLKTVQVQVEEGIVEVLSPDGGLSRLRAGDHILLNQESSEQESSEQASSEPDKPQAATTGPVQTIPPSNDLVGGDEAGNNRAAVSSMEITEAEIAALDRPEPRRVRRVARPTQAQAQVEQHRPQVTPTERQESKRPAVDSAPGARGLLEQAQRAQAAGQRRRAAELYQQIMEHHPQDARASLAAFELGRVRMDYLGDAEGAMAALQWSLRTTTSAFREDAMARLVRSAENVDRNTCLIHREAYLSDYPSGRYAEDVKRRCQER